MLELHEDPDVEEISNQDFNIGQINSISQKYGSLRGKSKGPTFALTFQGTWSTLVRNIGFPEEEAKEIEKNYHELYKQSDAWVQERIYQAHLQGYSEGAFGLRIRTPLLSQVMWGRGKVPHEAQAEARTLGNAISGQSYGMLNNRAAVAFMKKVWASPYRNDIKIVALIHDAIYLMIRDDLPVVAWVNKHLIDEMRWQELPEIQHDTVKLGAALDIFYNGWHQPITLPNDCDDVTILEMCNKVAQEYK